MTSISALFEPAGRQPMKRLDDIAEAVGSALGAKGMLLTESDLAPEFLSLQTGLAGDLFQKCVNYRIPTVIVMPEPSVHGARWQELAFEYARHPMVRIMSSVTDARTWLEHHGA
jgi:Domain of unknown function (DUF4180)